MLSLVTAGAPEGGLSGGCQGAILSSRRLNVKKEIPIIGNYRPFFPTVKKIVDRFLIWKNRVTPEVRRTTAVAEPEFLLRWLCVRHIPSVRGSACDPGKGCAWRTFRVSK